MRAIGFKSLSAALLALALVFGLSLTGPWHALEYKTFDLWSVLAAPGHSREPIAIVAVDEPSFQQLGTGWPFPRGWHAQLIERLVDDGARAIALDMVFADPAPDAVQDTELADAIARAARAGIPVILASAREQVSQAGTTLWTQVEPLPELLAAGAEAGDAGVRPDEDFIVRRLPQDEASLSAVLARRLGATSRAEAELLAYRGPRGSFDTRSYYQAVESGLLPPGFFKGRIVIVGRSARTASELQHVQADVFNSPFGLLGGESLMPGVELHATMLENRLTGSGLAIAPEGWGIALVLLGSLALLGVGARAHPAAGALLAAALALGVLLLSWLLFTRARLWLAPLWPLASLVAVYLATALLAWAGTRRHARQVRAMFARYVPPGVVNQLVAQPRLPHLGGEVREVTLMFTDLASFTTMAERLSAEQTVEVLSRHFNAMIPLIHASGGTVDKFIGDAIMAFWGAPLADDDHALHAVHAAIAMQQAMGPLEAQLAARGLPGIQMRIGVHTGQVVVGNVGSEQRFSYTAIGDAVNLASRLEGANKAFGTGILISGDTARRLPPDLPLRALDDVIVKGKSAPVRVFTPCADEDVIRASRAVLDALQARDAPAARAQLQAVLARLPGDPAALRLLARLDAALADDAGTPWPEATALDKL